MALDTQELDAVLKEFYLGPVNQILNNATVLLKFIPRDSNVNVEGKYAVVPFRYGRNLSAGRGVAELGALPTAGTQKYANGKTFMKYIYGTIRVSGPVIRAAKSDAGAFVRAVESETRGITDDMKRSVNRDLNGDGTGALAYWTEADNTSPVDVDDNQGNAFHHLAVGQDNDVDLVDATDHDTLLNTGTLLASVGADAVDGTSTEVSWTGGTVAGSADGDYLVYQNTLGKQPLGIRAIISDQDPPNVAGTLPTGLQEIPVGANPWWKSQIVGDRAALRELSFLDMQAVLSKIASNSSYDDKDVEIILTNYPMRDRYFELCRQERFHTNTMTLDGGFEALSYNHIAVAPDNQTDRNTMWFLVPDALAIFQMADFEWMDDGSVLRAVAGFDAYEAVLYSYLNMATFNRPALGALLGVREG